MPVPADRRRQADLLTEAARLVNGQRPRQRTFSRNVLSARS